MEKSKLVVNAIIILIIIIQSLTMTVTNADGTCLEDYDIYKSFGEYYINVYVDFWGTRVKGPYKIVYDIYVNGKFLVEKTSSADADSTSDVVNINLGKDPKPGTYMVKVTVYGRNGTLVCEDSTSLGGISKSVWKDPRVLFGIILGISIVIAAIARSYISSG